MIQAYIVSDVMSDIPPEHDYAESFVMIQRGNTKYRLYALACPVGPPKVFLIASADNKSLSYGMYRNDSFTRKGDELTREINSGMRSARIQVHNLQSSKLIV